MERIWVIESRRSGEEWKFNQVHISTTISAEVYAKWQMDFWKRHDVAVQYRAVPYVREAVSEEPRG